MHLGGVAWRLHDLSGGPPRGPIAQIPVDLGEPRPVVGLLSGGMIEVQPRQFRLDQLKALWGHEIVRRNRTVGQLVVDVARFRLLLGEGLAHGCQYSMVLAKGIQAFAGLRVSGDTEEQGLDLRVHGERGYSM